MAVDKLDLDVDNPRLIVPENASQEELLGILYEEESLDELVPSLIENGYFEEEPLVVVAHGRRHITVEGNRRLATLKLLLDQTTRRKLRVAGWPTLSTSQRKRLEVVPCVEYASRDLVLPFLGFRHITGAKKWRPFQRARFVASLLQAGESLDEIEEVIGDTASATKKLYQDFVVYQQVTDELGIAGDRLRDRFSLLEVMLGQRPIKDFLGMSRRLPSKAVDRLVPADRIERLEEVVGWVFGGDEHTPVIQESRDINEKLAKVIGNDAALEHLRITRDLEAAYDRTDGEQQYLLKRVAAAERAASTAAGILPLYARDLKVKAAVNRLKTVVDGLKRQLK